MNPKAYIRLRGNNLDLRYYLGNGRPKPTGGGAEYEAGPRPQADAVTLFTGNALLTMDVPILLDGSRARPRRDVGPQIDRLIRLCFGRGRKPPPNFVATGPFEFSGERFQMSMPEWVDDPMPIVGPGGTIFRQALVLKLVQYNDPTSIKTVKRGPVAGAKKESQLTSIVLKQPMSLLQIAAKYNGDASYASTLGKLNNVADVRKKLKVGTRVRLGTEANIFHAVEAR